MTVHRRGSRLSVSALIVLGISVVAPFAQAPTPAPVPGLSCEEMETFLEKAKVGRQREIPVGVRYRPAPRWMTASGNMMRRSRRRISVPPRIRLRAERN